MVAENITQISRKNEIENLGFIRLVLMCIIVLYHSFYIWSGFSSAWNFFNDISSSNLIIGIIHQFNLLFHTRTFFIVSGFLYFYLKHECNKYQNKGEFIYNKLLRLVVPGIFIILCTIMPVKTWIGVDKKWYDYVFNAFTLSFIDQTWFLAALFWVFLIFILLDKYIKENHILFLVIFGVLNGVAIACQNLIDNFPDYCQILNGLEFLLYFYAGYKMRQFNFRKLRNFKWYGYLIIIVILYGISAYCEHSGVNGLEKFGTILRYSYFYIFPICMFYMLQGIADKVNKNTKVFKFLSSRTMVVYLLHQQIIYICLKLIPFVSPWVNGSLNFIISVLGALLIGSLFLLTKPTAFLLGEKKK